MSSRTRHRPHRGDDNAKVFVSGDTGIFGGPQGGAEPGASESGDLEARQYGVPQADIPGGVRHLVNPETHPAATVDKGVRPTDYHKHHGVPPTEGGEYVTPDPTVGPMPPADLAHRSVWHEAVPVRVVEGRDANGRPLIRAMYTEGPVVIAAGTVDPIRLADRDFRRTKIWICNETAPTLTSGAAQQSTTTVGTATSPAAGQTITSQALAAGTYTVGWSVQLGGTLAAADANNFGLNNGATQIAQSLNSAAAGTYPQPAETVVIPAGGATLAIKAIALATVGAVYTAQLTATPVPAAGAAGSGPGIRIGDYETTADNRGMLLPAGVLRDFNTQDSLYVTNQSGAAVTLSWGYETEIAASGS